MSDDDRILEELDPPPQNDDDEPRVEVPEDRLRELLVHEVTALAKKDVATSWKWTLGVVGSIVAILSGFGFFKLLPEQVSRTVNDYVQKHAEPTLNDIRDKVRDADVTATKARENSKYIMDTLNWREERLDRALALGTQAQQAATAAAETANRLEGAIEKKQKELEKKLAEADKLMQEVQANLPQFRNFNERATSLNERQQGLESRLDEAGDQISEQFASLNEKTKNMTSDAATLKEKAEQALAMTAALEKSLAARGELKNLIAEVRGGTSDPKEIIDRIGDFGPLADDSVPMLIDQLNANDPAVVNAAIRALGSVREGAKEAAPDIAAVLDLNPTDPTVVADSLNALVAIGAQSAPIAESVSRALRKNLGDAEVAWSRLVQEQPFDFVDPRRASSDTGSDALARSENYLLRVQDTHRRIDPLLRNAAKLSSGLRRLLPTDAMAAWHLLETMEGLGASPTHRELTSTIKYVQREGNEAQITPREDLALLIGRVHRRVRADVSSTLVAMEAKAVPTLGRRLARHVRSRAPIEIILQDPMVDFTSETLARIGTGAKDTAPLVTTLRDMASRLAQAAGVRELDRQVELFEDRYYRITGENLVDPGRRVPSGRPASQGPRVGSASDSGPGRTTRNGRRR